MNGGSRRQYILLGLLAAAVFAYFRYGSGGGGASGGTVGNLPTIEIAAVIKRLQDVSTVAPGPVDSEGGASQPARNLFQYGERRAPAPPPMTEAERKAQEQVLKAQEEQLRAAAAAKQAADEEAARQAAAAAAAQQLAQQQAPQPPPSAEPAAPPVPVKGPPPPINYKFVGVMGSPRKKVGVFVDGDKMVLARAGEIVENRFKVIDIGVAWADWGYVDPDWKDQRKRLYYGQ